MSPAPMAKPPAPATSPGEPEGTRQPLIGRLLDVCIGSPRPLTIAGRRFMSAIGKRPVSSPLAVGPLGLTGDEQVDLSVHGGLAKAVYAYPSEHRSYWHRARQVGGAPGFERTLGPGFMGENLCLQGLLESAAWIGDRLHFPDCVLRITAPREPCFKFNSVMGLPDAGRLMVATGCCGFYLAVERPGSLSSGQAFELEPGPRGLGVAQAFAAKRLKHLR